MPYFMKESRLSCLHSLLTKQTENYTDSVDADFSHELYIQPNASIHGSDGYVHVSYPRYFYNQSRTSSHYDGIVVLRTLQNFFSTVFKNLESLS